MTSERAARPYQSCGSAYPPSATGPYSEETGVGWSGPLRCVLSAGHEGDRHWNSGINWRDGSCSCSCHNGEGACIKCSSDAAATCGKGSSVTNTESDHA